MKTWKDEVKKGYEGYDMVDDKVMMKSQEGNDWLKVESSRVSGIESHHGRIELRFGRLGRGK